MAPVLKELTVFEKKIIPNIIDVGIKSIDTYTHTHIYT